MDVSECLGLCQYVAVEGLRRYGYEKEAEHVAQKYVFLLIDKNFTDTVNCLKMRLVNNQAHTLQPFAFSRCIFGT